MDAVLVPGGFGERGIEGKIQAVRFAREHGVPYLGICLGMQVAIVEHGRHVQGLGDANSTEFNRASPHPVIALISEWQDQVHGAQTRDEAADKGGTMRLGAQEILLGAGTRAREIFARDVIMERHRHRYEFNNNYLDRYRTSGMRFSGFSRDGPDNHGVVVDFRYLTLKQALHQFGNGPGNNHLGALGGAIHPLQNHPDALADGELLQTRLLALGATGLRLA